MKTYIHKDLKIELFTPAEWVMIKQSNDYSSDENTFSHNNKFSLYAGSVFKIPLNVVTLTELNIPTQLLGKYPACLITKIN